MNNAELIAALRYCKINEPCERCPLVADDDGNGKCVNEMHDAAADALEAVEAYEKAWTKKCERLERRIAELEAQLLLLKEGECEAKKPKTVKETGYSFYCDCPTCGRRMISNVDGEWYAGSFDRFCRMCGQKIDWSEYCGWSNKPNCGAKMKGANDEN